MANSVSVPAALPNHLQLPFRDGVPVRDAIEPPQSALLTDSISPVLEERYPGSRYFIGQDVGIYWRLVEERLRGAKSPDWYLVTDVPHLLDGEFRRSYVLWQEERHPLVVLEFAPSYSTEELDLTPNEGKFWVYENHIRPAYYGIFWTDRGELECYRRTRNRFKRMRPNKRGHYPLAPLQVELGLWQGRHANADTFWLRWWDAKGNLLLTGEERERAAKEQELAAKERALAEVERLAERLRALGIDPNAP